MGVSPIATEVHPAEPHPTPPHPSYPPELFLFLFLQKTTNPDTYPHHAATNRTHMRTALAGKLSLIRLAVQIRTGAVVKSGAQIYPDPRVGIALVFWLLRRLRQSQADQQLFEHRKIGVRGGFAAMARAGDCRRTSAR